MHKAENNNFLLILKKNEMAQGPKAGYLPLLLSSFSVVRLLLKLMKICNSFNNLLLQISVGKNLMNLL